MKSIIKLLFYLSLTYFANSEAQSASAEAFPLKLLGEAIEKGGLAGLNSYLDEGGKWPRITTDSFATKNKIINQIELVALSNRLVGLLRERAEEEPSSEINTLESEAMLFFALGEKLWRADGYRNRLVSLLCCDLASHRCGKIIILSRGKKMGPQRPDVFTVRNSGEMLKLFVKMIPENKGISESGLDDLLADAPVNGETWLEMIVAIRNIKLVESTVGNRFNEAVALPSSFLGSNIFKENIGALVFDYGWEQVMHESMLPALAVYLKNGGSLKTLLEEPTNATKFEGVMKNEIYHFSMNPVMSGIVNGDQIAGLVEAIQSPENLSQRLFGIKK
ncbi:hypothetical protein HNR46_004180 [Haloferula luteola]|uniref:Uncharacterized protein n=1 Tax=Haloferula luteola TaxID=595692 RepID=A0A840V7C1_9BACT|nr:hypothetical protein [Haloferula luteola]MBB5353915.1 hypothetical protein [Haloferula luteola]